MLLFATFLFYFIVYNEYFPTKFDNDIVAPTITHGQFCTWKRFFFSLIDRLVCTIQHNQTLDALIKYVE